MDLNWSTHQNGMPCSTSKSTDGAVNIAGLAPKFLSHCHHSKILDFSEGVSKNIRRYAVCSFQLELVYGTIVALPPVAEITLLFHKQKTIV